MTTLHTLAERVAAQKGISYEEARKIVELIDAYITSGNKALAVMIAKQHGISINA